MAALQFLLVFTLFSLVASIRCTNREPLNGETFHISARSTRKSHRHFRRQPTPNVAKPPPNNDFNYLIEDESSQVVSTPWELQQKVNRLLQLKQVSGTSIIAVLFLALAFRNRMLLEYLGMEGVGVPTAFHPPMKLMMCFLVIANAVSAIALFAQPMKMKVFGKAALAANIFNEALGMLSNVVVILHMFLLKNKSEAQVAMGTCLAHFFWASMLLSISRSRWISPTPRATTSPPAGPRGSMPPTYAPNASGPQPLYPTRQ
jgi:hypothetical protein